MKRLVCAILSAVILFAACISTFAAEMPDCKVSLIASHVSAKVGDQIKISLVFDNAADYPYGLAAFTATLKYNDDAVRLDSVKVAAPSGADVSSSKKSGKLTTLYVFASATKQPGFNTNSAFYTVTFTVLDSEINVADFSVTFDAITVTDYGENNKPKNYQVKFNSPKTSVDIIDNEPVESQAQSSSVVSSKPPVTSSNAESTPSQAESSSEAVSQPSSMSSAVESTTPPTESVENEEFFEAEEGDYGNLIIDNFFTASDITNSSVIMSLIPENSIEDGGNANPAPSGDNILFYVVMSIFAATVIVAVTSVIIILVRKNKH